MTSIWAKKKLSVATLLVALAIVSFSLPHSTAAQSPLDEAKALNQQAIELYRAGKAGEAIPLAQRALAMNEKTLPTGHLDIATSLNNLAILYEAQGRLSEAEPLYRRALGITLDKAKALNTKVIELYRSGKAGDAIPLAKRALAMREKARPVGHPDIATSLNNLAILYQAQGRLTEAEPLYRRALAMREKELPTGHPDIAGSLNNLAALYDTQGRDTEAEPLYKRALAMNEKALPARNPAIATSLNNLAYFYHGEGRYAEAELLYKRALAMREKALPAGNRDIATSLYNLAALYLAQGRLAEAESFDKRALATREKALPVGHPDIAQSLGSLAFLYRAQGRLTEAEPLLRRALAMIEKALPVGHPDISQTLHNLAGLYMAQRRWKAAHELLVRGTNILIERSRRGGTFETPARATRGASTEATRRVGGFNGLIKVAYRLAAEMPVRAAELVDQSFTRVQWVNGSAVAAALAQMAARSAAGNPILARLVREQQDLASQWQAGEKALVAASARLPKDRNADDEQRRRDRLAAIDARLAEIDQRLTKEFRDYAAFVQPEPLSIADVQALLGPDEALVVMQGTWEVAGTPEETFVWVVTETKSKWVRTRVGAKLLAETVAALRCGLDEEEWAAQSKARRCTERLGLPTEQIDTSRPLPFHLGIAHELYQALFGQVQDLIEGKRLLLVPSGALTSLPFNVLVTERPLTVLPTTFAGYRNVPWFGRQHSLAMLPAVSNLKALRLRAKSRTRAPLDYIGFGDPVLNGDGANCGVSEVPSQTCPSLELAARQQTAKGGAAGHRSTVRGRGGRRSPSLGQMFTGGATSEAVLEQVRAMCPLPETAYEIKCVSRRFRPNALALHLGANATEIAVKTLSDGRELERYRVVHFATHGILAGDVEVMARRQGEPALVMTPPNKSAGPDDDGLLTASEVAQLKLNADWVVLSACNTAAGDTLGAEALSGLARAFFYAQAQALLVSHWPVYSDAAVRLTTRAFAELDRKPKVGRAEALRVAMIELMDDTSQNDNAHPSIWAPFVVVGEGAK